MRRVLLFLGLLLALGLPLKAQQPTTLTFSLGNSVTAGQIVKIDAAGRVVPMASTDTSGAIGIAITGGTLSQTAIIATSGNVQILVDGSCTAGNFISISSTNAGQGHCSSGSGTNQQVATALTSIGAVGYVSAVISIGGGGSGLPAGCTSPGTGQLTCTGAVTVASVTASGAGAGYFQCASGAAPSIVAGQMQLVCPATAITGYQLIFPTISTTGPLCSTNSANVGTLSLVSLATNTLPKGGGSSACPTNSTVVDNGTTVATSLPLQVGGSAPTVTGSGILSCGEATGQSVLAGADAIACNFTNHCATLLNGTVNSGCVVGSSALTVVTIGSGTSISATLLCSTANCPAGTYRVNVYLDMTTPCATSGTYIAWLGYTDDSGARTGSSVTTFIPINGVGSAPATGTLTTTSTSNFGQGTYILRSTGAATGGLGSINYGTTATACGSAGPMVGKMYLTTERIGTI